MRELGPILGGNQEVLGWRCSGCAWSFHIKHPRPLDRYDPFTRGVVSRAFDAHNCEAYPVEPLMMRSTKVG